MKLSVIIPVRNGGDDLLACLQALASSNRSPDELILIDDASTDSSIEFAAALGVTTVLRHYSPRGPAKARNQGAMVANGDILIFIDADVVVHQDTLAKIEQIMLEQPETSALFGSYDDAPVHRTLVSLYKNLQHHFVHQNSKTNASTFWTGMGAIRRDVFHKMGGFNEKYVRPSIEDIELGVRLKSAGYQVRLCPDVQVTHLKRWQFSSLLRTDILDRAVPWSRLILSTSNLPADLNLDKKSRLSSMFVWTFYLLFAIGFLFPVAWLGAIFALATVLGLNFPLYRFFSKHGGPLFVIGALSLHLLYYTYSSLSFGFVVISEFLARSNWSGVRLWGDKPDVS